MKPIIIFTIIITVLLTSCHSTKWIQGTWVGEGDQYNGQKWLVNLSVDKKGVVEISYPSLSCSGTWRAVTRKKNHIVYIESIQEGISNCDQGVEVQVTKRNDSIVEVNYYIRTVKPLKPIATAFLTKE